MNRFLMVQSWIDLRPGMENPEAIKRLAMDYLRPQSLAFARSKVSDQVVAEDVVQINVLTCIGFQFADKIGHCNLRGYPHQQMDVVIITSDLQREPSQIFDNSGHVGKDIFAKSIRDISLAIFGAVDDVIKQLLNAVAKLQ